jgi:TIR domain
MAAKVFLCYRRDDSAHFAGRVQDRLVQEFGRDLLFMDVDAIPLGVNFSKVLRDEVGKCEVLLAVIGPNWLDARDKDGNRRLDDPNDFVRIEIAAALQREIPVIPILLDGARVPKTDQLPKDLEELALRNSLDVRHTSFHNDVGRLVRGLKERLAGADEQRVQSRGADDRAIQDTARGYRETAPSPRVEPVLDGAGMVAPPKDTRIATTRRSLLIFSIAAAVLLIYVGYTYFTAPIQPPASTRDAAGATSGGVAPASKGAAEGSGDTLAPSSTKGATGGPPNMAAPPSPRKGDGWYRATD